MLISIISKSFDAKIPFVFASALTLINFGAFTTEFWPFLVHFISVKFTPVLFLTIFDLLPFDKKVHLH